jgi:predicted secreted protein
MSAPSPRRERAAEPPAARVFAWRRAALPLALAAALAAGCATPEERARRVDTGGHVVTLGVGSATSLELRRDQELRVRLVTEPTTRREWMLADNSASDVLAPQGGRSFEREPVDAYNLTQAAGYEVFRFKPMAPGTATLRFDYRRPRDLEPAMQSVSFTITVK